MASTPEESFLWRISPFSDTSGRGGLVASGRWHTKPKAIVYCSERALTSYCEVLRQVGEHWLLPDSYRLLKIRVPARTAYEEVSEAGLPAGWNGDTSGPPICQPIGDTWFRSCRTALLRVPSVVGPGLTNVLINCVHRASDFIEIASVEELDIPTLESQRIPEGL